VKEDDIQAMTKCIVSTLTSKAFKINSSLLHFMGSTETISPEQIYLGKELYLHQEMKYFKAIAWSGALDRIHQWNASKLGLTQSTRKEEKKVITKTVDRKQTHSVIQPREVRVNKSQVMRKTFQKSSIEFLHDDFSDLNEIKGKIKESLKELEEIKKSKQTHYKFSHVLLACTIIVSDLNQSMKEAVMKGAKD
jgi:hypothetical protein